ncbi:MAG TPA: extracellular solute-binding protein [Chloroflexota bacterium]|nr:extracellular solute-binding protein [Chloroflexota bacterium]
MTNERFTRRQMLLGLVAGSAGLVLAACGGSAEPAGSAAGASSGAASSAAKPAPGSAAAQAVAGSWDDLVAAAKKEGKVVISGPPDPETRAKLPPAFKDKFGIELEYLGGNSSQLAARIESERAANQYSIDASVGGSDTFFGTFLAKKWLDPLKPALVLPDVTDSSKWKAGSVWFRDPDKNTILQLFNTVQPMLTLNLEMMKPSDIPNADALLDPKWKGKLCAYDPSVNGAGIAIASAIYVAKGEDYATKLYKGQNVALSRDYQQVADWVAQGSYPIAFAATLNYLDKYIKSGVKVAQSGSAELPELPDSSSALGGGFGDLGIWNRAPHPNAARVFANWIASKEGLTIYSQTQQQVPARTDIDPTWLPSYLVPKPNVKYLDTYDYDFELNYRLKIRDFYNKLLK